MKCAIREYAGNLVAAMVSALDRFPNDGDATETARRALHRIFVLMRQRVHDGELAPLKAAQMLDSLTIWARFILSSEGWLMLAAEEWFCLDQQDRAEQGLIRTLEELTASSEN